MESLYKLPFYEMVRQQCKVNESMNVVQTSVGGDCFFFPKKVIKFVEIHFGYGFIFDFCEVQFKFFAKKMGNSTIEHQ